MDISDINKMLGSNYPTIESFERDSTWEKDLKGKSISASFANTYPNKIDWDYYSRFYNLSEASIKFNQDKVNWSNISSYRKLSEDFIREFQDKVSWYNISKYQKLSEQFIEEFQDKIEWACIISSQKLDEKFTEKILEKGLIDWKFTLEHQKLSESFIIKHIDKFDINLVCRYQKVSEKFIEDNIENLNFESIITNQLVSIAFVEKYNKRIDWISITRSIIRVANEGVKTNLLNKCKGHLDWNIISRNCELSINIVRTFQDDLNWNEINKRASFSEDFIREFQDKLDWVNISRNCKISEAFIEEFENYVYWEYIGENYEYSLTFIRKHKDKLKRAKLTTNDLLIIRELKDCISFKEIKYLEFPDEILYEFRDKVNWESLIKYKRLPEELIDKVTEYFGEWEWRWLSDIQPLSENFIRKYRDKVHWGGICMHQILSEEFIEEFDIENQPFIRTSNHNHIAVYHMGKLCSPFHVWWEYILKYQKLSSDFSKKISSMSGSKRKYLMLPYQKNDFTLKFLNTLSDQEREKYLSDSWLYKTTEFRKEQVINLDLFECFDDYFIADLIVDKNRFGLKSFLHKFEKSNTLEIFATQTDEERTIGFEVGTFKNLFWHYSFVREFEDRYFPIKVKVFYEDVVRVVESKDSRENNRPIVRCKKLLVLD